MHFDSWIDAIYLPIIFQCLKGWILPGEDTAKYKSCCIISKTQNKPLWELNKKRKKQETEKEAVGRPCYLRFFPPVKTFA